MSSAVVDVDMATLIDQALVEDIGSGDVTTEWIIPADAVTIARFVAKEGGIISGLDIARLIFERLDSNNRIRMPIQDGAHVSAGQSFAEVHGSTRSILTGERTALNFLRHMSGVATLADRYNRAVSGTGVRIVDTRKTTPGLRRLEKEAVRAGGGHNHRIGLYDMILIKDNHIAAAGSITSAVNRCRERMNEQGDTLKIEVEAETHDQVSEAAGLMVDRIMLDNMSLDAMRTAVALVRRMTSGRGYIELEASGAITLDYVRAVAETGVDMISIGALTHSAPALDISLDIE